MVRMLKAFVMKRVGEVGTMEKAVPEPGPNDALVKTTAADHLHRTMPRRCGMDEATVTGKRG